MLVAPGAEDDSRPECGTTAALEVVAGMDLVMVFLMLISMSNHLYSLIERLNYMMINLVP